MQIHPTHFVAGYDRFQALHRTHTGRAFAGFDEGLLASEESYKPYLRQNALEFLAADQWERGSIGSGAILEATIASIELNGPSARTHNNLVMWQNRFGHANRDHFVLLDAREDSGLRTEVETLLFDLYRNEGHESTIFERFSALSRRRFPFVAYLYFLKDIERFTPIRQRHFARVFRELGIDDSSLKSCSWDNYQRFLASLEALRPLLSQALSHQPDVALIDAHSFCWVFAYLLKLEAKGELIPPPRSAGAAYTLSPHEKSVHELCSSVIQTTKQSNGQMAERRVKNKVLGMSRGELERFLNELLDRQNNQCALSGLPLQFNAPGADRNCAPSVDRIDSQGHYERDNLQVVCQFINFWKGSTPNEEFRRLLKMVQTGESD